MCAACHGASGVSVSDNIPNLAQQFSADDMANVAAYFAEQPDATMGAKSDLLANVMKTTVSFHEGYQQSFTRYHSINFPGR
ncbi:MAG: cytochrome c553 [Gammaproteobacteria bacterium]